MASRAKPAKVKPALFKPTLFTPAALGTTSEVLGTISEVPGTAPEPAPSLTLVVDAPEPIESEAPQVDAASFVEPHPVMDVGEPTISDPVEPVADEGCVLRLPAVLDLNAAAPLVAELLALRGEPITIDAADVQRLGALCLQALISAATTWAADGHDLRVVNPSAAFDEALEVMGATDLFETQ